MNDKLLFPVKEEFAGTFSPNSRHQRRQQYLLKALAQVALILRVAELQDVLSQQVLPKERGLGNPKPYFHNLHINTVFISLPSSPSNSSHPKRGKKWVKIAPGTMRPQAACQTQVPLPSPTLNSHSAEALGPQRQNAVLFCLPSRGKLQYTRLNTTEKSRRAEHRDARKTEIVQTLKWFVFSQLFQSHISCGWRNAVGAE